MTARVFSGLQRVGAFAARAASLSARALCRFQGRAPAGGRMPFRGCRVFGQTLTLAMGPGVIADVVAIRALPANLPVSRPVRLYRQDTGLLVGETQSAPDGTYRFANLAMEYTYYAVAIDTTRTYRAAVADALTPVLP